MDRYSAQRKLLLRLGDYLGKFSGCFGRRSRERTARVYVEGLLSDAERKSMEPLLGRVHDPVSYEVMQRFISDSIWDEEKIWSRLRLLCPDRRGVLVIDDTGLPKQGRHSVGVQRQYSGTLGKIGNCQVAVSSVLRSKRTTWPLAFDLYVPQSWIQDEVRRRRSRVPYEYEFQEKWKIALAQIERAKASGLQIEAVAADADYGTVTAFREGIAALGLPYAVAVGHTLQVFKKPPHFQGPEKNPLGRPRTRHRLARGEAASVGKIAQRLPEGAWKLITWRQGTKGPLQRRFAALRVTPSHGFAKGERHKECWLLLEKSLDGSETKYYLSNLSPKASALRLVRLAHSRWAIEQSYQQMKEELGLDHFEGRNWQGFHHHVALIALAFSFLQLQRRRPDSKDQPTLPQIRKIVCEAIGALIWTERFQGKTWLAEPP